LTWPKEIFFLPKGKKTEKFGILGANFPKPNSYQRWLTQPKQQKIDRARYNPGKKFLTRTHHYQTVMKQIYLKNWSNLMKQIQNRVWVVIWFEAGILSQQPGFDSRPGKPQKKTLKRPPVRLK